MVLKNGISENRRTLRGPKRRVEDMENFVHHAANPGPVFFERGILDALCALDHIRPLNDSELSMWLSKYQYSPEVFVLPPWKAIYEDDAERDYTFEHAEWVNRIAQEWYRRCGYLNMEYLKEHKKERMRQAA
jgi:predicted ATPase